MTPLILGALLSSILWLIFWPDREPAKVSEVQTTPVLSRTLSGSEIEVLIREINEEKDPVRKQAALMKLERIGRKETREVLEDLTETVERGKLSPAMSALLINWSQRDPAEAMAWAWDHLRDSSNWPHAVDQIGPQWAWDDPESFAAFVQSTLFKVVEHRTSPTLAEVIASKSPVIGREQANRSAQWLLKSSPRASFQVLRLFSGRSSFTKETFVDSLQSVQQLSSALSAWSDHDPVLEKQAWDQIEKHHLKSPGSDQEAHIEERRRLRIAFNKLRHPRHHHLVKYLISRWKALDVASFEKSEYAQWGQLE